MKKIVAVLAVLAAFMAVGLAVFYLDGESPVTTEPTTLPTTLPPETQVPTQAPTTEPTTPTTTPPEPPASSEPEIDPGLGGTGGEVGEG